MQRSILIAIAGTILFCLAWGARAIDQRAIDHEMAKRVTNSIKMMRSLDLPASKEITQLILQENFIEFENRSKKYETKFLQDPLYESPLSKLYEAIDDSNDQLLEKLDKWVDTRPSYISYGARGIYKTERGYYFRGDKYIHETPPENISKMIKIHEEAKNDLLIALDKNRKFAPAYAALIDIERASGNAESAEKILTTAVQEIPQTYYIRHAYLIVLKPRWGGSYAKMQAYADSLKKEALVNPRIWSLRAEASADRGFSAWHEKDYKSAIQYYTEALSYGDRMSFLENRGYIYMALKQYDLSLADLTRYREYDKTNKKINDYIESIISFQASQKTKTTAPKIP